MPLKDNIRKIIFITAWLLAGAGVIVLLVAAANSRAQQKCKGYAIKINGSDDSKWFIDKKQVLDVITSKNTVTIKNKPVKSFDLNAMESKLKREVWVKDAEVYFDNNGMLKVNVTERIPVARIFNTAGNSFYIDSTGKKLPLSPRKSARLPVFTGYPFTGKKMQPGEKKLLNNIRNLSTYLANDEFWMAQVAQVDITPAREFEMIPTIGNHVIEFGNTEDIDGKFKRLMVFYRQVLSKTGMEKYERIKVQYDKQVIGVKKSANN